MFSFRATTGFVLSRLIEDWKRGYLIDSTFYLVSSIIDYHIKRDLCIEPGEGERPWECRDLGI